MKVDIDHILTYNPVTKKWLQKNKSIFPSPKKAPPVKYQISRILYSIFASFFLPIGYPSSVSSDYGYFQVCDTIQALCSYLRGLLTTRATLIGIGVGNDTASATSALMLFIFRDISGLIGSVLFSWKYCQSFGTHVKQWRLFADVINDIAYVLFLISPAFQNRSIFLCLICCASVCQAMCGCAAGATKIAIAKHFALKDNETDVIAKEGIQETFVTFVGMLLGLMVTSYVLNEENENDTNVSSAIVLLMFSVLTVVHVIANYLGIRSLHLKTLNIDRTLILLEYFADNHLIPNAEYVALHENVWKFDLPGISFICDIWQSSVFKFDIHLGVEIREINGLWISNLLDVWNEKFFISILVNDKRFEVNIAYDLKANDFDILRSLLLFCIIKHEMILIYDVNDSEDVQQKKMLDIIYNGECMCLLNTFESRMADSEWKVRNLYSMLGVKQHRYLRK